jgi:CheY-like chemotaxis protein
LLLTTKVQPADQEQFAQLGVRGVIPKPFDPMTLHDQVSELLGWSG